MMSGPSPSETLHEASNVSKSWTCIECNQVFSQSKLLETHATDTDHKAYRCTKEKACGKVFTLRPSWIRHERSHSAKKTHACSRCGKKFHRKDNCHDHERTCGRVARKARMLSQSASTSPTTTTSSGKTESGMPVDLLTSVLHEAEPSRATESGYRGLKPFDTPDATIQRGNGHDDGKAEPSVFRQLISVPTKPPPASSTAVVSATNNGPTQCRAATFHSTIASHTLEPENDTLLTVDNTELPTASRDATSQPDAVNDWRHYYQFFQSPYDAPSPDLQHTEDDWVFSPEIQASHALSGPTWENLGGSHSYWPAYGTAGSTRRDNSDVDNIHNNASNVHYSSIKCGEPVNVSDWLFKEIQDILHKAWRVPGRRPHGKMAELPERKPPSKIAAFFLRAKAYIKAPFRRHKQ